VRTDRSDRSRARAGRARASRPAAAIGAGVLVLALTVGATSGCSDLRLEGAQPTTPSAGPVEQVRQRAAEQAIALAASASGLESALRTGGGGAVGAPAADPTALATALAGAREAARTHLDDLGGVWVPFPDASPSSAAPQSPSADEGTPAASPSSAGDVAAFVSALGAAAEATQADAATVTDRTLARLLASIGLADELWAARLATLAGLPAPAGTPPAAPTGVPAGLSPDALAPLIASEDALGAAWEVVAARSADAARDHAAALATAHRDTAQAWAKAAGLAGVAGDPRRAAYQLPAVLTDPASAPEARTAVLAGLEDRLAGTWLDLVAQAEPDGRGALVSAARTAVTRAIELSGAAIPVLPAVDPAVGSAG
jgi:hypothetical protein